MQRISVEIPARLDGTSFNVTSGRLLVIISKNQDVEPRFTVGPTVESQQVFGIDLHGVRFGTTISLDDTAVGYPLSHLSEIPEGDYSVQAVLNVYEEFHLSTGVALQLPPDRGEGQNWNTKPGNLTSKPQHLHLNPSHPGLITLKLDTVIAPILAEPDTSLLRHVRVRSKLLSKFWGRDIYLGAIVLLPAGWAERPEAHFPVVVWQDHFSSQFQAGSSYRETPPPATMKGEERRNAEAAYSFYQDWVSGRLPRVLLVQPQHATPYYDDSYAVNSANMGPYGDAITQELIPAVEAQFRGIGAGWARATAGASTGGWEALASQLFYPDFYNGAYVMCPDPVDFHAYGVANLYDQKSAYVRSGPFSDVPIPALRAGDGDIIATMASANRYELAIASHGRSAEQYDVWQAVFSPAGQDGYPKPIFNKETGEIDKSVAQYWHDHYDLTAMLQRDWARLGPKLEGKLHFTAGESDSFYLNNAVHLLQNTLQQTASPRSDATFDYGARQPHCYTGARPQWADDAQVGLNFRVLPLLVEHMRKTAPRDADLQSWNY